MALSANSTLPDISPGHRKANWPVLASVHIWRGAALGVTPSGYLKPFEAGDPFVGFAAEEFYATSSDGGRSIRGTLSLPGKDKCEFVSRAETVKLAVTSAARTDIGKYVYATDDATFAFSGHPDGKVGRMIDLEASGYAIVEMETPGVHERDYNGVCVVASDFAQSIQPIATFNSTYAQSALGNGAAQGFKLTSIGAGITAAAGWASLDGEAGGAIRALLDNDNEAQNLTCETATFMNVTKGMTFEYVGRVSVLGPTATTDVDFGLITAASSAITAGIRADIDVNTAGIGLVKFHIDGDSVNILAGSDDNSTVVSATDTTLDNSLTVDKRFKIIVRASGAAELWIDGVRYLSSTTFSVGTSLTTLYAGFVNIEKSTGTDVSAVVIDYLRVAGAS